MKKFWEKHFLRARKENDGLRAYIDKQNSFIAMLQKQNDEATNETIRLANIVHKLLRDIKERDPSYKEKLDI